MAKKESIQKRLQKVRPPRVQLTYEVERGDAIEVKELPFVVGVVGATWPVSPRSRCRSCATASSSTSIATTSTT